MLKELLICACFCSITTAIRRSMFNPWTGTGTYAGPGGAFAGAGAGSGFGNFAGAGAGAAAGGGMFPVFTATPFFWPFGNFPFNFNFPITVPWYEGPNVCKEEKVYEMPEDLRMMASDPSINRGLHEGETESCSTSDTVHICEGKRTTSAGTKHYVTRYQCCDGYEKKFGQNECTPSARSTKSDDATPHPVKLDESTHYNVVGVAEHKPVPAGPTKEPITVVYRK